MLLATEIASGLQARLLDWWAVNQRSLPWRVTSDPYAVWVSEIMLQQTQVDRVIGYFERWMQRYPDPASLARADEDELLKLWEGLGYYNRARNMVKAARVMVCEHGGAVPQSREALLALPGVGPYTAGAVRSLAFNAPEPAVDANVERVLARVLDIDEPVKSSPAAKALHEAASALIPEGKARDFNQALMELGALVCNRNPQCEQCPLAGVCQAKRMGIPHERPVPGRKQEITPLQVASGLLLHQGRLCIQKRPETGVWAGLWEFPGGRVEPGETPSQAVARELREELGFTVQPLRELAIIRHGYTTYRVTLHCWLCRLTGAVESWPEPELTAATEYRWARREDLEGLAFPAGHRKLIDQLQPEDGPKFGMEDFFL